MKILQVLKYWTKSKGNSILNRKKYQIFPLRCTKRKIYQNYHTLLYFRAKKITPKIGFFFGFQNFKISKFVTLISSNDDEQKEAIRRYESLSLLTSVVDFCTLDSSKIGVKFSSRCCSRLPVSSVVPSALATAHNSRRGLRLLCDRHSIIMSLLQDLNNVGETSLQSCCYLAYGRWRVRPFKSTP